MVQNMITLLSVMIALLLVLIAINAVLRWLNPRNINGEEAAAFRAHRQNVFGFLALAVLFLGAYVGVSVLDNSVFFAVNSAVTPGLVYGSRLLVKLLATVAGIAILVIVLLLLLGMVVCGARSVWYAVFNKQDKVKEIKEGSQALLIKVLREPLVKGILTLSVFAAFIVIPLFCVEEQTDRGLFELWKTGVMTIGQIVAEDGTVRAFPEAFAFYLVLYVIVLGTAFGAANIVYIIFDDLLTKMSGRGFLREYSNSIGLLAVGVALLYSIFLDDKKPNTAAATGENASAFPRFVGRSLEAMAVVILLFAVVVIVLEIINLLMDMRDTLLREEGGFIFSYLILLGATLLASVLHSLYSAFENGIHKEWKVCDTHEYPEGVYVLDKITANTGVRLKEYPQELIFANQLAGVDAQDGILLNGTLTYQEGSLLFKPDVSVSSTYQTRYIASIDEYVPVHCYDPKRGENLTQPAMDLEKHPMKTRIVVIALNPKGTRIVAIYLIINN